MRINDEAGLMFASEVRHDSGMGDPTSLKYLRIDQVRGEIGDLVHSTACLQLYRPLVSVAPIGAPAMLMSQGESKLVEAGDSLYRVQIVRSEHIQSLPCGVAMELPPWRLEYVVDRVEDVEEARRMERAANAEVISEGRFRLDGIRDPRSGDVPPDPSLEQDGPPNPELKEDR